MSVKNFLENNKPREKSGTVNSNRTTYQLSWAFNKLIELHKSGKEYVMIFDYHDDIVILDSPIDPKTIDFYQIKTKASGNWTVSNLISSKDGKQGVLLSILGKMYDCKYKFVSCTNSLNLISNARYQIELESTEDSINKNSICIEELSQKQLAKIRKKLQREHNTKDLLLFENACFLKVTDLSLRDHENHCFSYLVLFIEGQEPKGRYRLKPIQQMIIEEIRKKNNYEWDIKGFENILKYKSIGKEFLDEIIEKNCNYKDQDLQWTIIANILTNEGVNPFLLKKIQDNWKKYELLRMDVNNLILQKTRKEIKKLIADKESLSSNTLMNFIDQLKQEIKGINTFNEDFINAAILMEYYD